MSTPKVGYLLKKFPRLSETFVLNEILHQEALGTPLHVFSRRTPDAEPRHPELARLRAPVEVLDTERGLDPWLDLFGPRPENHLLLERFGALVRELSAHEHARLPSLFAEALQLLRRTRALGIDHLHAHFATDSALVAMLCRDLGGPTYSVTAHAKDIYRSAVKPALLARLFERSAFTVTVCEANVTHLREMLPSAAMQRVRRLYNGIDLESFRPRPQPRDTDHILCVARIVEKKGFDVLARAIALLAQRGVACRATFVGDGEDRARTEALVEALSLRDRVQFTGALPQDGVRELMARATVQCLPCRIGEDGNRDALPTTLIEGLAMGLPNVSTPVTGIPEILGDGAGVLVPENDPIATADALQRLLGDPAERARISAAGRERVARLFDARSSAHTLRGWFEGARVRTGAA